MFNKKVECKYCHRSHGVRKHGTGHSGYQRYRCVFCRKTFQIKYVYMVYNEKAYEEVATRFLAGQSIYEISQTMGTNVNTIRRCLSKAQVEASS